MNIAIIEDEPATARDLARVIREVSAEATIVSIVHSLEQSTRLFESDHQIDLVFSDIQLGDGLSFELFERLDIRIPVVFCTAHNQYAMNAFKVFGLDYILKPFDKNSIRQALDKYTDVREVMAIRNTRFPAVSSHRKDQLVSTGRIPAVLVHQADRIIPLGGAEIALFCVDTRSVMAHLFNNRAYAISQNLDKLEEQFSGFYFRANRQFLINRKAVKDAAHHFGRQLRVNLTIPFPEPILIGKRKVGAFLEWLAQGVDLG